MQLSDLSFPATSARRITNWRYASSSKLASPTPIQRYVAYARATNWRYGVLPALQTQSIARSTSIKYFAINWRYQISLA